MLNQIKKTPLLQALIVEYQKVRSSKILWISVLAVFLISLISALFMFILQDPERARQFGLVGAKAQFFGGTADWHSLFNLNLLLVSVGGLIIFGFLFVWIFGREFSEKTIYDLLSLPTSRITIVAAKLITASVWSLALTLVVFGLSLGIGAGLRLPAFSTGLLWHFFGLFMAAGGLSVLLSIPFALAASITRGYLPAVGCLFLALILGQVISQLGYGALFPWTIPLFYSGAAEALTGKAVTPLALSSYIIVIVVSFTSTLITAEWWRHADQT
jgi:ABC-2 type transport system permease protein